MLSLELNDAELQLARLDGSGAAALLASEPGAVQFTEGDWLTGAAAVAQSRARPQQAFNRHWQELSVEALGRGPQPQLSAADLAYTQLRALLAAAPEDDRRLLIAVPASLGREQLGLLLGVAGEAGASEVGLVDLAVAACAHDPVPPHVVHLELFRHQALVTSIEHGPAGARRARFELDPSCGLQRLEQLWIESVAAQFVRQTRLDPLHHSASEQQLLDDLPAWLATVARGESAQASLTIAGQAQQVEIARGQLVTAAEPVYAAMLRLVQRARPAGRSIELRLGAQGQRLPGLCERLQGLNSSVLCKLPPAAAALGALKYHQEIFRGGETALVWQLPLPAAQAEARAAVVSGTERRATHVVFAGQAWALRDAPLVVGSDVPAGQRALALPAGIPGVSRQHCRLRLQSGVPVVEDLSTYGSFINDERVHGSAPLQRGDRLRLGTPGVTLELIALAEEP